MVLGGLQQLCGLALALAHRCSTSTSEADVNDHPTQPSDRQSHAIRNLGGSPDRLRQQLVQRFRQVRQTTVMLMAPLQADEFRIQSMDDVSPPYWNLGHTSWFFARNVLQERGRMPKGFEGMDYALNSYYEGLGPRLPRGERGKVASPSTEVVRAYRDAVDEAILALLSECSAEDLATLAPVMMIGCQHEEQHQELFVTEIQHIRWSAPDALRRGYLQANRSKALAQSHVPLRAVPFAACDTTHGYRGRGIEAGGFCWDNELPEHRVHVDAFELANRLITNAEWLAFIEDGGYRDPLLWLSNGWQAVKEGNWQAPLYWQRDGRLWQRFSLYGLHDLEPHLPVCHISFYEAEAFARWYGEQHTDWQTARLPREIEWEHAARSDGFDSVSANLLDSDLDKCAFDVNPAEALDGTSAALQQMAGTAWEWTSSHYEAYPGYRPYPGALTEYNGKFMDNQRVLRGGSFATPRQQARVAYRNFWAPTTRFQASSVRLLRST
jgi:ergothioneine biosynthesis protein EgtB